MPQNRKARYDQIRLRGAVDFRAGKPIEAFYRLPLKRHTELERGHYETGWRDAKRAQDEQSGPRYEVVPHRVWRRDDGRTASVYGSLPWVSADEEKRWGLVEEGFTVYNPLTGEYGAGRPPFPTLEAAQAFAASRQPSRIPIGG